jgi:hypothetical protein
MFAIIPGVARLLWTQKQDIGPSPRSNSGSSTTFPAYLVPFSIILHITTIRVLLANRRRARDEHTSVANSAMTASG